MPTLLYFQCVMKHILLLLVLVFTTAIAKSQTQPIDSLASTDSVVVVQTDTVKSFNDKTASATLRRIWPEPFYDFLQFDFNVFDCTEHGVEIKIVNSQNELV